MRRPGLLGLTLCGAAISLMAACAAAGQTEKDAQGEKRVLLSEHETLAVFEGVEYRLCQGQTALCPKACGDSGEVALLTIKKYLKYKKHGEYGDPEQKTFQVQVSDYDKKPKGDPKVLAAVRGLKKGDAVLLSWRHDYVTRAGTSFPERPLVRLEKADLMAGQWEGTWSSTSNGMGDRLRCTVIKSEDGKYTASFEAIFAKIFTHRSTVTLAVEADGDKWEFRGKEDLGLLSGGVYTYEGYSDGQEFYSTYDSTFDKGVFRMKRAATPAGQP